MTGYLTENYTNLHKLINISRNLVNGERVLIVEWGLTESKITQNIAKK
jgi:hypothetical protein